MEKAKLIGGKFARNQRTNKAKIMLFCALVVCGLRVPRHYIPN
jgi:hypothetical protein